MYHVRPLEFPHSLKLSGQICLELGSGEFRCDATLEYVTLLDESNRCLQNILSFRMKKQVGYLKRFIFVFCRNVNDCFFTANRDCNLFCPLRKKQNLFFYYLLGFVFYNKLCPAVLLLRVGSDLLYSLPITSSSLIHLLGLYRRQVKRQI